MASSLKIILLYIALYGMHFKKIIVYCHFSRFFRFGTVPILYGITPEDIIYCTLPLYHSAGGCLAVSTCLLRGNTLILRRKFSASKFWDECVEHKATVCVFVCVKYSK